MPKKFVKGKGGAAPTEDLFDGMGDVDIERVQALIEELRVKKKIPNRISGDLFDAISDGDIEKVQASIDKGASMRVKLDGMYPIQKAVFEEATLEKTSPKKGGMQEVLALITEKSKAVGLEYKGMNLVDREPTGLTPIEDLFDAISDGDIEKVKSSISRGANMRIKISGMYPLQRALLVEAMLEETNPKKDDIRSILTLIEEKSKAVGLEYEGRHLVDKTKMSKSKGKGGVSYALK